MKAQSYRDVIAALEARGWVFLREAAGSHEIWGKPGTAERGSVPHHKVVSAGVLRQLAKALGETPQQWQ